MKTLKIKGGRKGYQEAVGEAYFVRGESLHSPCIRYSHKRGFHVESAFMKADDDVIWHCPCSYYADSGKKTVPPYSEVREMILSTED